MRLRFCKFLFLICPIFIIGKSFAQSIDSAPSLSFSWPTPVALSVFERQDYIWLVFDRRKNIDIDAIEKTFINYNPEILQIPHSKATVIRMKFDADFYPYVRKEGFLWIIDFLSDRPDKNLAPNELETLTQVDGFGNQYLFVPTKEFVEPISVVDPDVGDIILVEASIEAGNYIDKYYDFVDFEILDSAQGFAVVPKSEDVYIIRGNTGVSIKKREVGINISKNLEDIKRKIITASKGGEFTLAVSESLLKQSFLDAEALLKKEIEEADVEHKDATNFELAKYYAAKGLGFETVATVDDILKNEKTKIKKEFLHALRGVGNFLVARYDQALKDFSFGNLEDVPEAQFWQAMLKIATGQSNGKSELTGFSQIVKDYPKDLKIRISLVAAQHAIDVGNDISAQNFIDILNLEAPVQLMPAIQYLAAQNLYEEGFPLDAFREFIDVSASLSQMYSSYARLETALLGYKIKRMSYENATKEMERLKFAWGERKFKIKILSSLAKIYADNRDYANAIAAMIEWQKIANEDDKKEINARIIALFEELYLENMADNISALKSLSLYKEYLSYIQKSEKYIDIDISVADRFLAVDLADKAKAVLLKQFANPNISSEQRYKIGTRLALIYTYQGAPIEVIKALDASEVANPEINLDDYRKVLRAIAYKSEKKFDKALKVLEDNYSQVAILLKAEIYWGNADWDSLAAQLTYLIDDPKEGVEISEEQIKYILHWLMALKKSQKEIVIARARSKLMPWFETTKYFTTFDMLTSQFDYNKVDMTEIEKKINSMSMYSDFSKKINENLAKIGSIKKEEK